MAAAIEPVVTPRQRSFISVRNCAEWVEGKALVWGRRPNASPGSVVVGVDVDVEVVLEVLTVVGGELEPGRARIEWAGRGPPQPAARAAKAARRNHARRRGSRPTRRYTRETYSSSANRPLARRKEVER
jgi:hypothetical protein